jgi:DNA-binding SARP family transcriptional activator
VRAVQRLLADVDPGSDFRNDVHTSDSPVLICLLGGFRLLTRGQPVVSRSGGKLEELLSSVALSDVHGLSRERLLARLWPNSDMRLAAQSLNTLIYNLHRLLGKEIGGQMPVVGASGVYRLNRDAGIDVDVSRFDRLTRRVGQHWLDANSSDCGALDAYLRALEVYRGDLCVGNDDVAVVMERERLRVRYHGVLCELVDYHARQHEYEACLERVHQLLRSDPCREDAHRWAIRCYVRLGQRAQALHQFRVCEQVLRAEYDAAPEPATVALFEQVRLDPASV